MVVAGMVGIVLTIALIRQADQREDIAVAASALDPGTVVSAEHLEWTSARLDAGVPVVSRSDLEDIEGMVLTRRIAEGDIVSPNDFRSPATPSGLRAVSIPIPRSRAVNGNLEPGDRIDIIHASGGQAQTVIADIEVLDVHDDSGGGALRGGAADLTITVAVTAQQAELLTAAVTDGNVIVARSTGSQPATESVAGDLDSGTSG